MCGWLRDWRKISSLAILARKIEHGREISQQPSVPVRVTVGPSSRPRFAKLVFRTLLAKRHEYDVCIVQGYGLAALAANSAAKLTGKPTLMFVCSANEEYYRCRVRRVIAKILIADSKIEFCEHSLD